MKNAYITDSLMGKAARLAGNAKIHTSILWMSNVLNISTLPFPRILLIFRVLDCFFVVGIFYCWRFCIAL